MNRGLTLLTAALTAASAGLVAGPAAAATPIGPSPLPKPTSAVCATGAITSFTGAVNGRGNPTVTAYGWMQPCASVALPAYFTVIYYGTAVGMVTPSRILPFGSVSSPTSFGTAAAYETRPEGEGGSAVTELPQAICAGRRDLTRVDCVRVEFRGVGQPPLVYRIPLDDPAVRKVVVYAPEEDPQNGCGNCV
jgi:hypothetical protein